MYVRHNATNFPLLLRINRVDVDAQDYRKQADIGSSIMLQTATRPALSLSHHLRVWVCFRQAFGLHNTSTCMQKPPRASTAFSLYTQYCGWRTAIFIVVHSRSVMISNADASTK